MAQQRVAQQAAATTNKSLGFLGSLSDAGTKAVNTFGNTFGFFDDELNELIVRRTQSRKIGRKMHESRLLTEFTEHKIETDKAIKSIVEDHGGDKADVKAYMEEFYETIGQEMPERYKDLLK